MLGRFASRTPEISQDLPVARPATAPAAEAAAPGQKPQEAKPDVKPHVVSCIGPGMSITGNIVCNAPMQVLGRIEGELRATEVEIGDGAHVEGNIMAQDLTIRGRVKGTVRAVRVRLQGNGAVEGDIFHRSLSIEEHALFEGSSRRVENPVEPVERAEPRPASSQVRSLFKPSLAPIGDVEPDTSAA